jgi:hypothetical protein
MHRLNSRSVLEFPPPFERTMIKQLKALARKLNPANPFVAFNQLSRKVFYACDNNIIHIHNFPEEFGVYLSANIITIK